MIPLNNTADVASRHMAVELKETPGGKMSPLGVEDQISDMKKQRRNRTTFTTYQLHQVSPRYYYSCVYVNMHMCGCIYMYAHTLTFRCMCTCAHVCVYIY